MEISNAEIITAVPALRELLGTPLPVRAGYKLARLARAVEAAAQDVEATRLRILERWVERDTTGEPTPVLVDGQVQPGQVNLVDPARYRAEVEELFALATELAAAPLRLDELGDGVSLAPATLLGLGPLLVDDTDAEVG